MWSTPTPEDVGVACAFGSQCASGRCSADVPSGGCGVCLDVRRLGERCDGPLQACNESAVCQDGVCRSTKRFVGEPCSLGAKGSDDLHECDDELYCGSGPGQQGTCTAYAPPGGACGPSLPRCGRGTYCAPGGTCVEPTADSCVLTSCPAGFFCHAYSTCLPATLPLGALCGIVDGSFVDGDCEPGTVCGLVEASPGPGIRGIEACVALPGAGELCIGDRCAQGLFCSEQTTDSSGVVPRRCEPLREEGEACSTDYVFHKDCAAGLECRDAICAPACK